MRLETIPDFENDPNLSGTQKKRRRYYYAHHEELLAASREYGKSHRAQGNANSRAWRAANHERAKAWNRAWAKNRRNIDPAYRDAWKKYRIASGLAERVRHSTLKVKLMAAYGGHCVCCGESEVKFLSLDHIHNDGAQDRKLTNFGSGSNLYRKLAREGFPQGVFQILCYNCNMAKGMYGECPHQLVMKQVVFAA